MAKKDITEELAQSDADCSREELIAMLEGWYGKEFDNFVLLTFEKEAGYLVTESYYSGGANSLAKLVLGVRIAIKTP